MCGPAAPACANALPPAPASSGRPATTLPTNTRRPTTDSILHLSLSVPGPSLHQSVLQRLRDVIGFDARRPAKIRHRPRDLQHAVVAAGAEADLLDRAPEQIASGVIGATRLCHSAAPEIGVRPRTTASVTRLLQPARGADPLANRCG